MADDVARVIAAASALGTACNMAVSYANYRRKRPKAKLRASCTMLGEYRGEHELARPQFELRLRNLSESPTKIVAIEVQASHSYFSRTALWQLTNHRRVWRGGRTHELVMEDGQNVSAYGYDKVGELPWTLEPFQSLKWCGVTDGHFWCRYSGLSGRSVVRTRVCFPGGHSVESRWMPITPEMRASTCLTCVEKTGWDSPDQLSFDDI
ncbi:hypothetical protein AB0L71_09900 [Streptomyces sp. NPDC052052]|uniref:hypothetical protein n=1 Tax=Streptomyces sp. NPDC052052 TaxID=3154756 RepID=UPI003420CF5D